MRATENDIAAAALGHPMRTAILREAAARETSPRTFIDTAEAKKMGATIGTCSYHFRVLADADLLTQVRTQQRRGALQHWYRASPSAAAMLAGLAGGVAGLAESVNGGPKKITVDFYGRDADVRGTIEFTDADIADGTVKFDVPRGVVAAGVHKVASK